MNSELPLDDARDAYKAKGIKLLTTYGAPLTSNGGRDENGQQLRANLHASGLLTLRVPGLIYEDQSDCALWAGIRDVVKAAPAIRDAVGDYQVLFTTPDDLPGTAARRLVFDDSLQGLEVIRADQRDGSNGLALPHAGNGDRWARYVSTPLAPELLLQISKQVGTDAKELIVKVVAWLTDHFEPTRPGFVARVKGEKVVGLPRDEIYGLLLKANHWVPSDFTLDQLTGAGDIAETAWGNFRHRVKSGYVWQVRRNSKPLTSVQGESIEHIDPALLSAFRSWQVGYEYHPARVRERRVQEELQAARDREAAFIVERFGSRDVFAALQAEDYFAYHQAAEGRRLRGGSQYGERVIGLALGAAKAESDVFCAPDWWTLVPKGTAPEKRYRAIVRHIVEGLSREEAVK